MSDLAMHFLSTSPHPLEASSVGVMPGLAVGGTRRALLPRGSVER